MDIATLVGLLVGLVCIVVAMYTSGGVVTTYLDAPSALITVGGSYCALMMNYSIADCIGIFKTLGLCFKLHDFGEMKVAETLLSLSERARREGLLSLEEEIESVDDDFMKRGLRMVVDSTDPEIIRNIMETELSMMNDRHSTKVRVVNSWSVIAPGMGMLGTVQGLVAMMKNLEDKSAIGPNMAVALITTYYGALMANFLLIPLMGKLINQDADETKVKEMAIEGVLSIQQGDNPHILQMKMASYLSPENKKKLDELHPQT